jgi:hypothetical protein
MVVSKWEHELDKERMSRVLNRKSDVEAEEPEAVLEGVPTASGGEVVPEQA